MKLQHRSTYNKNSIIDRVVYMPERGQLHREQHKVAS